MLPESPKIEKLKEVLSEHFQRYLAGGQSTRAIVFVATRATVFDVMQGLNGITGILPVAFVGQANKRGTSSANSVDGLTQQEHIVSRFRAGLVNCLVATCIAEEGLDIGGVDLIVCYDGVSSPLRLVQRMGRTGRQRAGRVVLLVTDGMQCHFYINKGVNIILIYYRERERSSG